MGPQHCKSLHREMMLEDAVKQEVPVQPEAHYVLAQRGELLTSFGTQRSRNSH